MIWGLLRIYNSLPFRKQPRGKRGFVRVKVVEVYDGDTIRVQLKNGQIEKVRFLLIDTPELHHPQKGRQPYSRQAKVYTKFKIYSSKVVELSFDQEERDLYGRLLAYVYCDRKLLQEGLVRRGYARVCYTSRRKKEMVDLMRAAQEEAKIRRRGIWKHKGFVTSKGFHPEKMNFFSRMLVKARGRLLYMMFG
jgi:micrococcal nuclease